MICVNILNDTFPVAMYLPNKDSCGGLIDVCALTIGSSHPAVPC